MEEAHRELSVSIKTDIDEYGSCGNLIRGRPFLYRIAEQLSCTATSLRPLQDKKVFGSFALQGHNMLLRTCTLDGN